MARSQLRVYYGPEAAYSTATGAAAPNTVTVSLSEILPLLADAYRSERTWLRDFAHDQISISSDLYEMILAYQYCRRPSA